MAHPDVLSCPTCGLRQRVEPLARERTAECARCGSFLAALILYVPANIYPIMRMHFYGAYSESTVWDGVVGLARQGEWLVAAIVFLASIAIPLVKLGMLLYLVASAALHRRHRMRERTRIYRFVDAIGPYAPVAQEAEGLALVLRAERPRSIRPNTPVQYRGVDVGVVQKLELGPNSTSADIYVLIYERYAGLVRQGSAFWNTSGINLKGGLLKGIEVDVESLRSIATGGIEFATPSEKSPRVKPGTVFFLYDQPKNEWLSWLPRIPVPPAAPN